MRRLIFILVVVILSGCGYFQSLFGTGETETNKTVYTFIPPVDTTTSNIEVITTVSQDEVASNEAVSSYESVDIVETTENSVEIDNSDESSSNLGNISINTTTEGNADVTSPILRRQEITPNSNMAVISMPIRSRGDSVKVDYKIDIPSGMVSSKERITLIPTMVFDGRKELGQKVNIQGEGFEAEPNIITIPYSGGVFKGSAIFHYDGTPADNVAFYLIMETTIYGKNKFGSAEDGEIIDTIFSTKGISVIDRLLRIAPFIQTADRDNMLLDSIISQVAIRLSRNRALSAYKKDSILSAIRSNYMAAIIDNNLGVMAYQNGDKREAKELFNQAKELTDILEEPRMNSALIALDEGDYARFREEITEGHLLEFINGNYEDVIDELTGHNRALAQILISRLNMAEETLSELNDNHGDILRLVIHAHRGDNYKIDSIMSNHDERLKEHDDFHIVANEVDIYR